MTVDKFQRIAALLANGAWVRYWLNWNDADWSIMAIQCIDYDGTPLPIRDAESHCLTDNPDHIYTVPRTNEDGTPWKNTAIDYSKKP